MRIRDCIMMQTLQVKIAKYLCTYCALLIAVSGQDLQSSVARQVNGNVVTAQLQNNSLPALSERASGGNSRYLSAAGTASLAAATVVAANGVQASSNQQDPNRNFLSHQHQPQSGNSGNANNQQVNVGQQAQQQSTVVASPPASTANNQGGNQAAQFNSPQGAQVTLGSGGNTPVMSTTYKYNPLTGEFVPIDLSASSFLNNANLQSTISQLPNQLSQFQAQQPFFAGQTYYGASSPSKLGSSNYNNPFFSNQYQPAYNQQQILRNQQQQQQYNRRTGYQTLVGSSPSRLNSVYGQTLNQQQQPVVEDDMSGFFQQNQVTNTGADLSGNFVNNLDSGLTTSSVYGGNTGYNQPGNQYLIAHSSNHQSSGQQQQGYNGAVGEQQLGPLSTSLSSVILPNPSNTFNTAFTGPPSSGGSSLEAKSDQCVAADNRHGTCYQASECIKKGGTPMGKCGSNNAIAEFSGSSYVCCLFDVTCGQFAAERFVYFRNPNYPNTFDQTRMCRTKIGKLDKGVCQFRLDMIRFDVAKPTNGNCSSDMFVVSGQNENYVIPKICGLNDGQHYYVGVDESGVITLHMMMMGYYRRSFEILITQIPCRSDYAAPAHCLQYYMGTHGVIKSFNYDDELRLVPSSTNFDLSSQANQADSSNLVLGGHTAPYGLHFPSSGLQHQHQRHQHYLAAGSYPRAYATSPGTADLDQFGGYPNDLDYTMCIKKESGFCSITYQLSRGEQGPQPFAVGHPLYNGLNSNNGELINGSILSASGWHPVSTECRDDYLLIGGVRLCSGSKGGNQYLQSPSDLLGGSSIQFAQNGTVLNSAGINHQSVASSSTNQLQIQSQLQNQLQFLVQQLARIQQQQQQQQASGNVSYAGANSSNNNNNNFVSQQTGNSGANLDQQQAAILQQIMLLQQQLNSNNSNLNRIHQQQSLDSQYSDLQGAIITDTTSGPFILRFVSNSARNAKGFQIDYRQNPCK